MSERSEAWVSYLHKGFICVQILLHIHWLWYLYGFRSICTNSNFCIFWSFLCIFSSRFVVVIWVNGVKFVYHTFTRSFYVFKYHIASVVWGICVGLGPSVQISIFTFFKSFLCMFLPRFVLIIWVNRVNFGYDTLVSV